MCANGSKKAAPTLHAVASTWSSCVELPIQRMFLGISAALKLKIFGADAIDAYAHSPAPDTKTYLSVNEAFKEWWNETCSSRSKPPITRKFVIPVQHCLQGHLESGKQWMRFIDNILINEMGFRTTTHDRKKLKRLSNWNEWKAGETKQIEQFQNQQMFGDPIDPSVIPLPDSAVIL